MFTKPFRVKSNTPVKGSERKKIKAELQKCFPTITEEDTSLLFPNKEDMSVMKIETHSGEVISAHLVGKKPIVFHIREKLYPTVYFLWILPGKLIPYFTTWEDVVPKLNKGADLMLPGIIVKQDKGIRCYGRLNKGELVAINTNKNSAAVAIGKTALSSEDMYMAGRRGKGVEILHCVGDFLYKVGTQELPPELGPPELFATSPAPGLIEEATSDEHVTELKEDMEVLSISNDPTELEGNNCDEKLKEEETAAPIEEDTRTPQEIMDELLNYCFLKALKKSAKKIELPVLTSNFFRLHIVPACPSDKTLDVKKSSYKKISKFLEAMQKDGIVTVKELSPGVERIMEINSTHERIRFFKVDESDALKPQLEVASTTDKMQYQPPVINRLYSINAATLPLFSLPAYRKGTNLTAQQVRQYLTEYVKEYQLQDVSNKGFVKLDPILSDVLLKKGERIEQLSWEDVMSRCLSKLSTVHEMIFPKQPPVIVKGQLEPVDISTASRAGNKKVTLVSGLETYRISLEEFAHRCQVGVAASTTITTNAAKKGQIVLVQGNQVSFVGKLLIEDYGIPKQFIQGYDLKNKDKKSRK